DTLIVSGLAGLLELEDQAQGFEIVTITGIAAIGLDASDVTQALMITGNSAGNAISGTAFADSINGGAGNDVLLGRAGNDTLTGGAGIDLIDGESGNDLILVNVATEVAPGEILSGGDGQDVLRFTAASGLLTLGDGVSGIEIVQLATAGGLATGTGAVSVNASLANGPLLIEGNNGVNT